MANTTTTHHSTQQSGNAETGFITVDREIQEWHNTPENGIYAGKRYMITTFWRGTTPGARHIMTNRSSAPYTTEPAPAARELPAGVASKKARREFDAWTARIAKDGLQVGQMVTATRVITDSRHIVLHQWEEPAVIVELRNFDALVKFQDGTKSSSGLGLRVFELPAI